ncbi:putative Haloacid dehalogenase-like hydrolase [Balamuthia mandrillaris]
MQSVTLPVASSSSAVVVPPLLALDMDGTLLHDDKTIPEANKAAVKQLSEWGTRIVLASGRMTPRLITYAEELQVDATFIGYNGAECVLSSKEGRKRIVSSCIPAEEAARLFEWCDSRPYLLCVFLEDKVYVRDSAELKKEAENYTILNGDAFTWIPSYAKHLPGKAPTKALIALSSQKEQDELYEDMLLKFPKLHLIKSSCTNEHGVEQEYVEFTAKNVNKGTALIKLCEHLNLDINQVVSMGDGDNDIEMLQVAGYSVCMAQGKDEAKRAAKKISPFTNNDNGVAREIQAILSSTTQN